MATTDDAEQVARGWMQKKYGKRLGRVQFVEVMGDGDTWNVRASVKLAVGVLLVKPHTVRVKIDAKTTEVLGYSETAADEKVA